jgi:uncharacterized protein YdhG (YjbR/CyaY superfamily)
MARSAATTVADYLAALPAERREVITEVRKVIRRNLPKGYQEVMNWGAITYELPLERYPDTYNGQPLCYAALAAQKNHFALYLMTVYGDKKLEQELRDAFEQAGKKLDMGKSCVRFKSVDQLPLDAIGRIIAAVPPDKYIAVYEKSRRR